MHIRRPSSCVYSRFKFSPADVIWAAASLLLALYLRNAYILSPEGLIATGTYCVISFAATLLAFAIFRIHAGLPRYFAAYDGINLAKAAIFSAVVSAVILFTLTRLDGIPRSTPAIHALLLWVGLVVIRALRQGAATRLTAADRADPHSRANLIVIGLNDVSSSVIRFFHSGLRPEKRVIAVLDDDQRSIGRAAQGVAVLGRPSQLDTIIEEFRTHGVRTDAILVAGAPDILADEDATEVRRVCAERDLKLVFSEQPFGFPLQREPKLPEPLQQNEAVLPPLVDPYFQFKRWVDVVGSLFLIIATFPLWMAAACLTWVFIGPPVLFWQQRVGQLGRDFDMHKFRTLQPPFDRNGRRLSEAERLSWPGRLLRATRVDELPQLVNVLVGEMSLIGPRPLLPEDQPLDADDRLMVRPGITGWAQVNGGVLLTSEEKDSLDRWYVRNASFWLDMRIFATTVLVIVRGDRRNENALSRARIGVTGYGPWTTTPSSGLVDPGQTPPDEIGTVAVLQSD